MLSHDLQLDCNVLSHLPSIAKWHTRPILHSALATKMGHVPEESYFLYVHPTSYMSLYAGIWANLLQKAKWTIMNMNADFL